MTEPVAFPTPADLWVWFEAHPQSRELWLLYHRKGSQTPSVDWQQAVEVALCWGWIDGVRKTLDETRWLQRFTPRKPRSVWSQKNRATAERLIQEGRLQPAGLAQVQAAQADGRWDLAYSGGAAAVIPADFLAAVAVAPPAAQATLATLNARSRFAIYYRVTTAKRPETRAKRIHDLVAMLARGEAPY